MSKHDEKWWPLAELMSEISERAYHAGWMDGLELALWAMVCGGPRRYGQITVDEETIAKLGALSAQFGGWIRFGDNDEEFVSLGEWQRFYAASGRRND
jgi:hypothetical protein